VRGVYSPLAPGRAFAQPAFNTMQEIAGYIHVLQTGGNSKLPLEKNNICIIIVYMRVNSLKPILYSLLFAWTVTALSVCVVEPIDLTDFVTDPKVTAIVEAQAQRVNLTKKSEGTAGNRAILVAPAQYYAVAEWEIKEDDSVGPRISTQFVKADGLRSQTITEIARVNGGRIGGLDNKKLYEALSAKPLEGNVYYVSSSSAPGGSLTTTGTQYELKDGVITLTASKDPYYIDFSALITGDQAPSSANYTIVEVPVSPAGGTASTVTAGTTIIMVEDEGTTDYVFADADPLLMIDNDKFFYLTVIIEPKPEVSITLSITVTYSSSSTKEIKFDFSDGNGVISDPSNYKVDQDDPPTITIALNSDTISSFGTNPTYDWYYDKDSTFTQNTSSISVDFNSDVDYLLPGTHTFTVIIKDDDGYYQADVTITVGGS